MASLLAGIALVAVGWCLWPDAVVRPTEAQAVGDAEQRTLGLRWRFARVQYSSHNTDSFRARYLERPLGD